MGSNERRSLPDWIERAYVVLAEHITEHDGAVSRSRAHEPLVAHDEFTDEPADATYAIERLIESGWLYVVGDEVRITDRDR